MAYQLLISTGEGGLERYQRLDFQQLPLTLAAEEAQCSPGEALQRVSAFPAGMVVILQQLSHRDAVGLQVVSAPAEALPMVNDATVPVGETVEVRNGALILCGQVKLRFYRLHGRPGVSARANAMGTMAQIGLIFLLILQLAGLCFLPLMVKYGRGWRAQRQQQEIAWRIDGLRRELGKCSSRDPVKNAWFGALQSELTARVSYLRRRGDRLDEAARLEMIRDLQELEGLVKRMDSAADTAKDDTQGELSLDKPVQQILDGNQMP